MAQHEYLHLFIEESFEHLQNVQQHLLALEQEEEVLLHIEEIFRSAHTLKGMAATMEYKTITELTHTMENVLDGLRKEELSLQPAMIDVLFQAADALEEMVRDIERGEENDRDVSTIVLQLEQMTKHPTSSMESAAVASMEIDYFPFERTVIEQAVTTGLNVYEITVTFEASAVLKAVRAFMVVQKLDEYGEMVKSIPSAEDIENDQFDQSITLVYVTDTAAGTLQNEVERISEIEHVLIQPVQLTKTQQKEARSSQKEKKQEEKVELTKTVRINTDRMELLMNLFEEFVIERGQLEQVAHTINHPDLTSSVDRIKRTSSQLQEVILSMRMMTVERVFNRFPSMIRKLSKELGKDVVIDISGQDTELDRSIIDEIGDPLVHLLRNAIDHGIETPSVRKQVGKPEKGRVTLEAYHRGNHVYIDIGDDGAGINRERVMKKAIENNLISESDAASRSDFDLFQLLFAPGFSTAKEVTDVSGRGVGLDVVKQTFEQLGGKIIIQSEEGKGSTFSIQLPLTLSIMDVLLIQCEEEIYGIPTSQLIETAIAPHEDKIVMQGQVMLQYRGQIIPVIELKEAFQVPIQPKAAEEAHFEDTFTSYLIVKHGKKAAAIAVDHFIGQQDVVIKPLGKRLSTVRGISGATILGNGTIAFIIDATQLLEERGR
ncbi:LOW QUALITY PROTEIN: signal transduction histidine kinase CheA [Geomicrobium sp. JCM 19055]|nr:LOW QUALITY PROTEIN: signal transduction histidine kinase CheA [Geomicrobium sp. JCM 19055]